MVAILAIHLLCLFGPEHFADESFHPTIPLRLINGDSLVTDEWHLTQFSSLFLYLPVRLWLSIKGSTEGIILFLRCFYLFIHTAVSVGIYIFFRKHKGWSVAAALMFYSQVPLRFMTANYHSLLALFLLLLTIALFSLWKEEKTSTYLLAGFSYGCCCICNPFECLIFPFYTIVCIAQSAKQKQRKTKKKYNVKKDVKIEVYHKYFTAKAFSKFFAGICVAAVISVLFFFGTGGTLPGLFNNIPNLLTDKGHDIFSLPIQAFANKIFLTFNHINAISFKLFFVLPVYCLTILIDKRRKEQKHKLIYIVLSLILSVFFTAGVTVGALNSSRCFAISLPFAIVSTVCYILTENKNKPLFYCMWLPGVIATIIQYLASDMHLSVMWVLTISNLAGIFFVKDFIAEFSLPQKDAGTKNSVKLHKTCTLLLCMAICLQIALQCGLYMTGKVVEPGFVKLDKGPYKGIYMTEQAVNLNKSTMDDLDAIKERTEQSDYVLIISEFSWMYMYVDRPFATYSSWQPFVETNRLRDYYKQYPEKIPEYIYVGFTMISSSLLKGYENNPSRAQTYIDSLNQILYCDEETLSNGVLLSVKEKELRF